MGGGRTLKASAAGSSSHSATQCTSLQSIKCDGASCCPLKSCTIISDFATYECDGTLHYTDMTHWDFDEDGNCDEDDYWFECATCGYEDYSTNSDDEYEGDPCPGTFCRLNDARREGGSGGGHRYHVVCEHGERCVPYPIYIERELRDYHLPCIHNERDTHYSYEYLAGSSSSPCTRGHSSYSITNHYYCTTHGYVGTSSTCPGLTINPSPSSMTVYYGQSSTISANVNPSSASVSFNSSNTNVATVSSIGKVTGTGKGNTTITVTGVI